MTQKTEPYSLALFGAPGSGKSKVAKLFKKEIVDTIPDLKVIDGYQKALETKYDTAVGMVGDHFVNLWIHYERVRQEQAARVKGQSFLTCGTVLEGVVYGGLNVENIGNGLQTPQSEVRMMREMHATTILSCFLVDRTQYHFGFWLPLDATSDNTFARRVDAGIEDVNDKFRVGLKPLWGTPDEQVAKMVAAVKEAIEHNRVKSISIGRTTSGASVQR